MSDGKFDDDERPTRVTCIACGGRWCIPGVTPKEDSRCPHCTAGTMTIEQVRAYRSMKAERGERP